MTIKRMAIAAITLVGVLASANVLACSCSRTDTDESRYTQARHVFTARVTAAKEVRSRGRPRVEVTVAVTEVFKGQPSKLARIWSHMPSGADSSACAVAFTVGEQYVLLLADDGLVQLCSGSKRYDPASEQAIVEGLRALSRTRKS
jgi:hypothetical protein